MPWCCISVLQLQRGSAVMPFLMIGDREHESVELKWVLHSLCSLARSPEELVSLSRAGS